MPMICSSLNRDRLIYPFLNAGTNSTQNWMKKRDADQFLVLKQDWQGRPVRQNLPDRPVQGYRGFEAVNGFTSRFATIDRMSAEINPSTAVQTDQTP